MNYEILYDMEDDFGRFGLKERANSYEEAVELAEALRECSYYSNAEVVNLNEED